LREKQIVACFLTGFCSVSAGMPNHFLWRVLGIPLIVAFVCLFAAFGFYAAHAIGEILDRKTK
jgi:hypothetical protein